MVPNPDKRISKKKSIRGGRKGVYAERIHALVLDDVGDKVTEEELKAADAPQPTFIVRTSPMKCQWVYVFPKGVPLEAFKAFRARLRWALDGPSEVHWWRMPQGGHPDHPGFVTMQEGEVGPSIFEPR